MSEGEGRKGGGGTHLPTRMMRYERRRRRPSCAQIEMAAHTRRRTYETASRKERSVQVKRPTSCDGTPSGTASASRGTNWSEGR